ncbi:MAG: hypothetical protein P1U63_10780 [Coxiellaceae bacterium]|nr:hypothetical protein [Coxiellaceae bacterium]
MPLIPADHGKIVEPLPVEQIIFGEVGDECREIDWHNAPCRQYIIMLQGAMEIELGSGEKKQFQVGEILLAEDLTGQGHITRAASEGVRRYLAVACDH